ncbi:helix-turn-helix domain-containing protein [Leclercia sp.]|uniref:helix-turn-helix domain-containing protein n=1 Tax=Leclercia sp. TaxID=1898428 RepID=UPI0028ABF9C5|nr:helix-turn-helix domain-containing protein [Leclercia sp.]
MSKPDWEAIESAYRAGVLSVRELAGKYGISHQAISKRAKKDGWERDLKAKVQAKADALVAKREVARQVATESTISERQLIEATAEVIATVRMEHRGDIRRARELTNTLFDELAGECGDVAALEQLGEMMRREDDKGMDKLNDLYHKIISLPSRVKSMKDLSDSLKTLIGLEREAYSIENKAEAKEVTHNVMLVPTSDNVDDWEAAAQKQQDEVLGG